MLAKNDLRNRGPLEAIDLQRAVVFLGRGYAGGIIGVSGLLRSNLTCNATCPVWPHAFIRVKMDPIALIERYDSHHIHGVYGDHIADLAKFCELKCIACEVIE